MSDEVNFVADWRDEATQCKNCVSFKVKDGHSACVPEEKTFEQALEEFGECAPNSHCNFFEAK